MKEILFHNKRAHAVIIAIVVLMLLGFFQQNALAKDKVTYTKWKQANKANSSQVRVITVKRSECYTKWKYIGPGSRGVYLKKGASLSYSPEANKNPVSVNIGAGVSIAHGIASGSMDVSVSVPLGSTSSSKPSVNCGAVKKKGYYGLEVRKKIKPTLWYTQFRHASTDKKGKPIWVVGKAELSAKKYKNVQYYYRYKKFKK